MTDMASIDIHFQGKESNVRAIYDCLRDDSAYNNETAIDTDIFCIYSVAPLDDAVKGTARWIANNKL